MYTMDFLSEINNLILSYLIEKDFFIHLFNDFLHNIAIPPNGRPVWICYSSFMDDKP